MILIIAGIVTILAGSFDESIFIFLTVVVNSFLGFFQEYKAEKAIAGLKSYLKQKTRVFRNGIDCEIDALNLVPGDIIRLSQGDRVPADAKIIEINDFEIEEAVLTGESLPVSKKTDPDNIDSVLADQDSMIFAGTLVIQGTATAVVCRTDFSTEIGKIAKLVASSKKEATPLQRAIKKFSVVSGFFILILTLFVFIIGVVSGQSLMEMFLLSVAIAVSSVPEGLPIALTVILAIGVQRMARRKGIVRKLVAAESLGSTSLILTDKTGTLTMAKMELNRIFPMDGLSKEYIIKRALINTSVVVENREDHPSNWKMTGKMLETALVKSASLIGIYDNKVKSETFFLDTLPFNAVNKFSVSLIKEDNRQKLVFFGAPDILINYSSLSQKQKEEKIKEIDDLALSGDFVVCVAVKEVSVEDNFDLEKDLNPEGLKLEGLISLKDPIRVEVKEAIKKVKDSGIRIVVISGDHKGTVMSIAREVGLDVNDTNILNATELKSLSKEDLKNKLLKINAISRVSPEDKLRIVEAFQEMGEIVAMTGDGVNDAPSIKKADVGIAMGSGTEVTRDVADLVLLDDNFETISAAVEEGRQIMNNIRRVLVYLLSGILDELILIGGALIFGLAIPLNALQLLWVNFFTDSFPAISFAFERDKEISLNPKDRSNIKLFDKTMNRLISVSVSVTSIVLFFGYWVLLRLGYQEDIVRTFIFATFGVNSLFLAFSVRGLDKSIFSKKIFSNKYLFFGFIIGLVMMALAIYVPFLQNLFNTVSLSIVWVLSAFGLSILSISIIEIIKWLFLFKNK